MKIEVMNGDFAPPGFGRRRSVWTRTHHFEGVHQGLVSLVCHNEPRDKKIPASGTQKLGLIGLRAHYLPIISPTTNVKSMGKRGADRLKLLARRLEHACCACTIAAYK